MSQEQESLVELVKAKTAFEAESIAAGLRARGIDARVLDAASAGVWAGVPQFGAAKVVVLAGDEPRARLAMEEMKSEASSIDWDAVDVGDEEEGARMTRAAKDRRWMWTMTAVLAPIGLILVSLGARRGDGMLQLMGGIVVVSALVMGFVALTGGERGK